MDDGCVMVAADNSALQNSRVVQQPAALIARTFTFDIANELN
jgi:hypothetical protein